MMYDRITTERTDGASFDVCCIRTRERPGISLTKPPLLRSRGVSLVKPPRASHPSLMAIVRLLARQAARDAMSAMAREDLLPMPAFGGEPDDPDTAYEGAPRSTRDTRRTCRPPPRSTTRSAFAKPSRTSLTSIPVATFRDEAISGPTDLRPGFQSIFEAATTGRIDVVVAESLDRLSRDLEHISGFFKRMQYLRRRDRDQGRRDDHRVPHRPRRNDERPVSQEPCAEDPPGPRRPRPQWQVGWRQELWVRHRQDGAPGRHVHGRRSGDRRD